MSVPSAAFLEQLGRLASPEHRAEAAAALARLLGGDALYLFAPDPELEVVLPAPGLPQVLRGAAEWRSFLERCAQQGELAGSLPGPDGEPLPARGTATPEGTAAVLLAADPAAPGPSPLRPLLPLLGALFQAERQALADEVRVRAATDAVDRAKVLNRALQQMRQRMEDALVEAEHARIEARERAEQAERLARELQVQAEQLQEQAVELEILNQELIDRTEEAEGAQAAAEEANRAKSQFLATMSHELRTPINAVIGYAQLLNLGITGPVTVEQQAQLERIRVSSEHLLGLVNDVLDLAKVEAGHMAVEQRREPVAAVVTEAIGLIEMQANNRSLSLRNQCSDSDIAYVGDRDRVRQIVVNLLSNAVKFTGAGGSVTLRCGTAEESPPSTELSDEGPWTWISVEDTGIGMDAQEMSRIFHPFVQAEVGHTRSHGGTGLGLTISRQLARLMGGDLAVQSEKGRGTRFTLVLPAVAPHEGALDTSIRVGPVADAKVYPAGVAKAGALLHAEHWGIAAAIAHRVQAELPEALVGMVDESEILSHAITLVAELGGILLRLGRLGGHAALVRDGSRVQRLLAEEHGADRGRRGWPPQALRRELAIVREEVIAAVRRAEQSSDLSDAGEAVRLLEALLEASRRVSLRSYGAVLTAMGRTGRGMAS